MPWRNGLYVRLQSWAARAAAGAPISAVEFDADGSDVATAFDDCILRDGTGTPTADIPFAGHSLTGIRQAVAAGEPMEFAQTKAIVAAAGGAVANRLQNASFLVNQRSVSGNVSLGTGVYGHDRWKGGSGGCTYTFAVIGADVQVSIGSGSLEQIVVASDVDQSSFTLSNAGTAQGRVYPLGSSAPAFATCPVTSTAISPGTPLVVEFSTGTVLEPQIEPGAVAHAFTRRPLALDTLLCQSFYELMPFSYFAYSGGGYFRSPLLFRVRKAAVPTLLSTVTNSYGLGQTVTPSDLTIDGFTFAVNTGMSNILGVQGLITASCEP